MTAYLLDLADAVRRWRLTRRTINALERLDDRLLDDAGVDRYQIASIAHRQSRYRVARDRVERDRRANERAEQRELTRREAIAHSRFARALDHAATASHLALTIEKPRTASRIPSVIDDIALGAAYRGEPCHAC